MFDKPISEADFLLVMAGTTGTNMDVTAVYFFNGVTSKLFSVYHDVRQHMIQPYTRAQLVKSIKELYMVPKAGKASIYRLAPGQAAHLTELADEFQDLIVYGARAGKQEYAIIKTFDYKSADAGNFWLGYHGSTNIPKGAA
jgi:hypothetical protein